MMPNSNQQRHWSWPALAVLMAGALAVLGQSRPASQPSEPLQAASYTDLYNGFALRPPAGAERSNLRSPSQLVSWQQRDAKTGAVVWTLAANKVSDPQGAANLQAFAASLATTLTAKEGFTIDSRQIIKVAGRDAIDIKGQTQGKLQWWQRQVWVSAPNGSFVVLRLTGSLQASAEMDALMTAVLQSLRLVDAKEALAQRQERLAAGAALLKALDADAKKVTAAIPTGSRYFLIRQGQAPLGFLITTASLDSTAKTPSAKIEIVTWMTSEGQSMLWRLTAEAALDRSTEQWSQEATSYKGAEAKEEAKATSVGQNGKLFNGMIKCNVASANGAHVEYSKTVPKGIYLPLAWTTLLPRLVDLGKPATYSFARYTASANSFDVHTLSVLDRGELTMDDKKVMVTRVEVRQAEDAPADTLWLDKAGDIVHMESGEGSIMDAVTDKELLKAFPTAAKFMKQ